MSIPFRRSEAFDYELQTFCRYEINSLPVALRAAAGQVLAHIMALAGRPVGGLPRWHPLVSELAAAHGKHPDCFDLLNDFKLGMDHVTEFEEGILTLPYNDPYAAMQERFAALQARNPALRQVRMEKLEGPLHSEGCSVILFTHTFWGLNDHTAATAKSKLRRFLHYVEDNSWTSYGEPWNAVAGHLLGYPHGSRSSLCVQPHLASRMKLILDALNVAEYHGPLQPNDYAGPTHKSPPYKCAKSRWYPKETAREEAEHKKRHDAARATAISDHARPQARGATVG